MDLKHKVSRNVVRTAVAMLAGTAMLGLATPAEASKTCAPHPRYPGKRQLTVA